MIYAKTGMESMPENCGQCEFFFADVEYGVMACNALCDPKLYAIGEPPQRLPNCPLVSIDETLPAQLECAELRIRKLDRLMEFEEESTT